jgi:mercuric ion transport protein
MSASGGMHNVRIQLLTFEGCPLADAARDRLEAALADCGLKGYEEIDILGPTTPDDLRGWGSPTILVDGADITGQPKGSSVSCRVYAGPEGVPGKSEIVARLKRLISR